MHISIGSFGQHEGKEILIFTIENKKGDQIEFLNYGATIHSWITNDAEGNKTDIIVGAPDLDGYIAEHPYFGCLVGRYANRINEGSFDLGGITYQLTQNLRNHHLHGGSKGWNRHIVSHQIFKEIDQITILFSGVSFDGEQGYPGNVEYIISYTFTNENELIMEYRAMCDKPTPLNLTNHAYFNLSGQQQSILDHFIQIHAKEVLAYNDDLLPTGEKLSIKHTPLDFQTEKKLAEVMDMEHPLLKISKGFDHCYVLNDTNEFETVATAYHPKSGIRLRVKTTEPAMQFYGGNWLGNVPGKKGTLSDYDAFCLETQHYPDSPNHPNFPNTILRPGELFYSKTSYLIDIYNHPK